MTASRTTRSDNSSARASAMPSSSRCAPGSCRASGSSTSRSAGRRGQGARPRHRPHRRRRLGIRFVIGEYGSGKTFFLHLVRSIALEKKLVTVHADLSPDRRLHATGGQARSLYAELMRNLATRAKPDGGAMA